MTTDSINRPYAVALPPRLPDRDALRKKDQQVAEAKRLAFAAESPIPSLDRCDFTASVDGRVPACVNCAHRIGLAMECGLHEAPTLPGLVCPDWD